MVVASLADDDDRFTIALPPGYGVTACATPAQYAIDEGRLEVGIVAVDGPIAVKLDAAVAPSAPSAALSGSFRADDDRSIGGYAELAPLRQDLASRHRTIGKDGRVDELGMQQHVAIR